MINVNNYNNKYLLSAFIYCEKKKEDIQPTEIF